MKIPVFFACDERYVPFFAVTLSSIKAHAKKTDSYEIYILAEGFDKAKTDEILALGDDRFSISIVDVTEKINPVREPLTITLRDYYSLSIFYRLFIPSLFPKMDKAIYLDCDIALNADLASLFETDLGDKTLGAVVDQVVSVTEIFKYYTKKHLDIDSRTYFNSGVLLMNLNAMREKRIEENFLELINKYNFKTVAPDQDYLNFLCRGDVLYLDEGWDRMSVTEEGLPRDKVYLVHYNMYNKPWHYDNVPYGDIFWRHAKNTPYYETLLGMKANYSEGKKRDDERASGALLESAGQIADNELHFTAARK